MSVVKNNISNTILKRRRNTIRKCNHGWWI